MCLIHSQLLYFRLQNDADNFDFTLHTVTHTMHPHLNALSCEDKKFDIEKLLKIWHQKFMLISELKTKAETSSHREFCFIEQFNVIEREVETLV